MNINSFSSYKHKLNFPVYQASISSIYPYSLPVASFHIGPVRAPRGLLKTVGDRADAGVRQSESGNTGDAREELRDSRDGVVEVPASLFLVQNSRTPLLAHILANSVLWEEEELSE